MIDPKSRGRLDGKKYAVYGGRVTSRADGQTFYVNAQKVAALYDVELRLCLLVEEGWFLSGLQLVGLVELRPREDGNYTLENRDAEATGVERPEQLSEHGQG